MCSAERFSRVSSIDTSKSSAAGADAIGIMVSTSSIDWFVD